MSRALTDRDRAFLDRHRKLGADNDREYRARESGTAKDVAISGEVRETKYHQDGVTVKSVRFFDGTREVWLPGQFVKFLALGKISIPEWLGMDRGLI